MPKFLGDFSAVEISNGFNDPVKALAVCAAAAKSKRYTAFIGRRKKEKIERRTIIKMWSGRLPRAVQARGCWGT